MTVNPLIDVTLNAEEWVLLRTLIIETIDMLDSHSRGLATLSDLEVREATEQLVVLGRLLKREFQV